jgi:tellurite resistance protein
MPTILFGTEPNPIRVGRGEFQCPECMTRRSFRRTRVARRLRVLGLSIPAGRYGEYVECETCLCTFRPEVLAYDAGARTPQVVAEYQRAMLRILALMAAADGVIRERELGMVQRIFQALAGKALSREEVLGEVRDVGRTPTTAARFLARVVGCLNEYGKEQIVRGAALVSHCDGELHVREAEVVRRLGAVLKLEPARVERILVAAEDGWREHPCGDPSS